MKWVFVAEGGNTSTKKRTYGRSGAEALLPAVSADRINPLWCEPSSRYGACAAPRVRVEGFTLPGDPMRIDYGYRRNGTRKFVPALSVSRAPGEVKSLAYTVQRIRGKLKSSELTAVSSGELCVMPAWTRFRWKASRCGLPSCAH